MAKNFTQFQAVTGEVDPSSGERSYSEPLNTHDNKDNYYVVGYVEDAPGGEAKFTLRSILLAADKEDIGLHNVTNESKETMFTAPTFNGNTLIKGDLQVEGDLTASGNTTQINYEQVVTSETNVTNNGTAVPLRVTQQDLGGSYDTMLITTGTNPAVHVNENGRVGIGIGANDDHQLTVSHFPGENDNNATVLISGSLSATYINGTQPEDMEAKLETIDSYASSVYAIADVSARLQTMKAAGENVDVEKGYDLLEDGDTYIKFLKDEIIAPLDRSSGHLASIAWLDAEGAGGSTPNQGEAGYGKWDASWDKLRKIEALADNTRANSHTINLNQVPDGEWNGTYENTFVKMTSADKVLLNGNGLRRIADSLHSGDDGSMLTQNNILSAYEEAAGAYYWSQDDEDEYRGTTYTRTNGTKGVEPRADNSVQNLLDSGVVRDLDDGDAVLNDVTITSLSATDIEVSNQLGVPGTDGNSANIFQGLTTEIDVGGTTLYFSQGVLWKVVKDGVTTTGDVIR
jgi:hypothetical protein